MSRSTTNTHHLPENNERIVKSTPNSFNELIRRKTIARLDHIGFDEKKINQRLEKMQGEWNFERCVVAIASFATLMSLNIGVFVYHRALIVTGLVGVFLCVHALYGWVPPLPILRRLGVRTQREIENERYILKARRGDFSGIQYSSEQFLNKLDKN